MSSAKTYRKMRGLTDTELRAALVSLSDTVNQHALVINAQRDRLVAQDERIAVLEAAAGMLPPKATIEPEAVIDTPETPAA